MDEPTRGMMGAKFEIYSIINQLAAAGKAIIVVSSDMEEIMGISDRILVMRKEIAAEIEKEDFSQELITSYAIGDSTMSGRRVNEKALKEDFKKIWSKLGVWLVFIFLFLLLSVAVGEKFLTVNNLINVIRQICVNSVVALGATFVVMCSEIDLSQGAMAALIGCICAMLMKSGAGVILSIIIALLIALHWDNNGGNSCIS